MLAVLIFLVSFDQHVSFFNFTTVPYRGAISFYVYIVALGLISIFLYVGRVQISCGLLPPRFCPNFPIFPQISDSFLAKTICVVGKIIKKLHT